MVTLLALLQYEAQTLLKDPKLLREQMALHLEVIACGSGDAEISETCPAADTLSKAAAWDALRGLLKDEDRQVRRNAACALALQGISDGREQLTVDEADSWMRKHRVAVALLKIDRPAAEKVLRVLLADPCRRARRAAGALLGEKAPEPTFTDAHRKAIGQLASEDAAVRDAAVAALMDAPEEALLAARGADPEVRARLDYVVAAIRAREQPPITLTNAGIVQEKDYRSRKITLTNHSSDPITYLGHAPTVPLYGREVYDEPTGTWKEDFLGWCGTGVEDQTLAAGASVVISTVDSDGARYRIYDDYRLGGRRLRVYSEPLTPGK